MELSAQLARPQERDCLGSALASSGHLAQRQMGGSRPCKRPSLLRMRHPAPLVRCTVQEVGCSTILCVIPGGPTSVQSGQPHPLPTGDLHEPVACLCRVGLSLLKQSLCFVECSQPQARSSQGIEQVGQSAARLQGAGGGDRPLRVSARPAVQAEEEVDHRQVIDHRCLALACSRRSKGLQGLLVVVPRPCIVSGGVAQHHERVTLSLPVAQPPVQQERTRREIVRPIDVAEADEHATELRKRSGLTSLVTQLTAQIECILAALGSRAVVSQPAVGVAQSEQAFGLQPPVPQPPRTGQGRFSSLPSVFRPAQPGV